MKKLIWLLAIAFMFYMANAQTVKKEQKQEKPRMEQKALKDHKCTAACKDGKHVYAHGEKGHKCSKECEMSHKECMKYHKCTKACKNGKHVYAHGEKGHKCSKECAKECKNMKK